ncbi:hypothetical protein F5B17DRAFT_424922 [Nemania serpens]|nr:hypothetical protein F5B17DRAFT_424922 [Nemania serpens]
MSLFSPILGMGGYQHARLPAIDIAFVRAYGIMESCSFKSRRTTLLFLFMSFLGLLDGYIYEIKKRCIEAGYYIAIANLLRTNNGDPSRRPSTEWLRGRNAVIRIFIKTTRGHVMDRGIAELSSDPRIGG